MTRRRGGRQGQRDWRVIDPQGQLVCLTVYKRGAVEVVRRLTTRDQRTTNGSCGRGLSWLPIVRPRGEEIPVHHGFFAPHTSAGGEFTPRNTPSRTPAVPVRTELP